MVRQTHLQRRTIAREATISGLGVRSGKQITVRLLPANGEAGITVTRTDLGMTWPVDLNHTMAVPNCTCIGDERGSVAFVEHLMAVLWAAGITDMQVHVDGPEIPLLDGSALPLWRAIEAAGTRKLGETCDVIIPVEPILIVEDDKALMVLPSDRPRFSYSLVHPHPMIGHQFADFDSATDSFAESIAPARTFATDDELQSLKQTGLIATGGEDNCLVIYSDHYSAPLFAGNAFARHKLMDLLGDLYLLGRPLCAHVLAYRTGHADNQALARRIAGA